MFLLSRTEKERGRTDAAAAAAAPSPAADRPRTGTGVPVIVAALALSTLAGGWMLFREGSPRVTTPPERGSEVYVLTDDPGARIHIGLQLRLDFGQLYDGRRPPLDLTVRITPSRDTPVRWAIVLNEGARLPWPAGEPAGNALPRGERRAFSDVWVQSDDVQEARFVRNASGFPFRSPDMLGSVLFGTGKPAPKHGSFQHQVVAPTDGPLVLDSGESYTMYLPSLGMPGAESPAEATAALAKFRDPVKLLVGEAGTDRLLVQAFAERPSWTARAQRLQFLAGVLAGLGGGFLIWSLELWYGVVARPGAGGG